VGVRGGEQRLDYTLGESFARAPDLAHEPARPATPVEIADYCCLCRHETGLRAFEQDGARLCISAPPVLQ
jgi:hypothetical protein